MARCTGRLRSCVYCASPNSNPSAQITSPQSSSPRPPIPKNVAWFRSGSTSAASPPAACWVGAGFCSSPKIIRGYLLEGALLLRVFVVLDAEVRDLLLTHQPAQRVLEFRLLDEEVVLGVQAGGELRALEVEREPFLNARQSRPAGEIKEQCQIEHDRGREDRVAAQEVDLDLHRIAQPSEDVDVVPPFLIVAAGWSSASRSITGRSMVKLGAPFANGTFSMSAA